jgi:hypothetical protein
MTEQPVAGTAAMTASTVESPWRMALIHAGAMIAWILQFTISYVLVDFLCGSSYRPLLYVISGLAILLAAGATFVTWQRWERLDERALDETRFRAQVGLLINGLFLFLTVLTGVATLALSPCTH